jgi:hypothetical protein
MDAYAAFVIWTLVRWIRAIKPTVFTMRDWLGGAGLLASSLSWLLQGWLYICCIVENKNLAEGSGYDAYYVVSCCAAITGMIFTLIGRNPVRGSSFIVALVMVLQWHDMLNGGLGSAEITTFATLALLAMYGTISLGTFCFKRSAIQV